MTSLSRKYLLLAGIFIACAAILVAFAWIAYKSKSVATSVEPSSAIATDVVPQIDRTIAQTPAVNTKPLAVPSPSTTQNKGVDGSRQIGMTLLATKDLRLFVEQFKSQTDHGGAVYADLALAECSGSSYLSLNEAERQIAVWTASNDPQLKSRSAAARSRAQRCQGFVDGEENLRRQNSMDFGTRFLERDKLYQLTLAVNPILNQIGRAHV